MKKNKKINLIQFSQQQLEERELEKITGGCTATCGCSRKNSQLAHSNYNSGTHAGDNIDEKCDIRIDGSGELWPAEPGLTD